MHNNNYCICITTKPCAIIVWHLVSYVQWRLCANIRIMQPMLCSICHLSVAAIRYCTHSTLRITYTLLQEVWLRLKLEIDHPLTLWKENGIHRRRKMKVSSLRIIVFGEKMHKWTNVLKTLKNTIADFIAIACTCIIWQIKAFECFIHLNHGIFLLFLTNFYTGVQLNAYVCPCAL